MTNYSIAGVNIPKPEYREAFNKVLPYEQIFNKNLLTGLAESRINPEVQRAYQKDSRSLDRNLAQGGGYRFGGAFAARGDLADQYERQRKEQVSGFLDSINMNLTDYYNKMAESYYKNPQAFITPSTNTFDQYAKQNPNLAAAYNNPTMGMSKPIQYLNNMRA